MNLVHSNLLPIFWLMPLVGVLIYMTHRRREQRLQTFSETAMTRLSNYRLRISYVWLKGVLLALGFSLLLIGLMRPRWGFQWKEVAQGGVDIMVVLDLSTSMLATDIPPNRLERAKREIVDLLAMLQGDRFGIVAFAGMAIVQCPLTVDYRLASLFVNQLSTELIPVQERLWGMPST